ncbi:MAG: alpha/beta hydrolase fold domain-containing protein [Paucibacter sp.]|nr:alpha/beta hydrolase fold domain-containing protein [Roseateles sp.]
MRTALLSAGTALVLLLTPATCAFAQDGALHPLQPPAEPESIRLGSGGVEQQPAPEGWFRQWGEPMVHNVSTATLTPFLPAPGTGNGAAVIVAPGGAFRWLSINNEGWKVAKALADRGIAAFVLKYRLIPTPDSLDKLQASMDRLFAAVGSGQPASAPLSPDLSLQLADAEAAYGLIVSRAKAWGVDPHRIGMVGFSAGAALTLHATLHSSTMKLAFIAPIYGGMGPVDVPKDAPPMFNVIASDDFLFRGQFGVVKSWFDAGRPVEFHLYQNGGHGFGLGYPGNTANGWLPVFVHWLEVNGLFKPMAAQ